MRGNQRHGNMSNPMGSNDTFDPFAPPPRHGPDANFTGTCTPGLCASYCNVGQQQIYTKVDNSQGYAASSGKTRGFASKSGAQQGARGCGPCEKSRSGQNTRGWPSAVGDPKAPAYNMRDSCADYNKRIKKEKTGLFSICVPSTCTKLAQASHGSDASAKGRKPHDQNDSRDDGEGSEGTAGVTDDDDENAETDVDFDEEEGTEDGGDDMNKDGKGRNSKGMADPPPDEEDGQDKGGFEMSQASWSLCKAAALFLFGVFLTKKMHIVANAIG